MHRRQLSRRPDRSGSVSAVPDTTEDEGCRIREDTALRDERPFDEGAFADAMAACGPFEASPALAVAVSGGADSLALCLLARDWAVSRGGTVIALTVDHGLRPESSTEAEDVRRRLRARGMEHHVLSWDGPKPRSGIPAAARDARYRLLIPWCRARGILHLLLGHQRRDQAETVLMRFVAGSGMAGLQAMQAVVETADVRLIRPLLGVPPERLRAFVAATGERWVIDPTNLNLAMLRPRLRLALALPGGGYADEAALAWLASTASSTFRQVAAAVDRTLARLCRLDPCGFARIDRDRLGQEPAHLVSAALGRVLATVGSALWPPGRDRVDRLLMAIRGDEPFAGASLGGCLIISEASSILICREARGLPTEREIGPGDSLLWDRRFLVRMATGERETRARPSPLRVKPLSEDDCRGLRARLVDLQGIPRPALRTLPALVDRRGLVAVPHLRYVRDVGASHAASAVTVTFAPRRDLSGCGCFLAEGLSSIMS
jgi:tRNA(Ile)-lysidine synthase